MTADIVVEEGTPADEAEIPASRIHGKSPTRIALGRLAKDKLAVACAVISLLIILLAAFSSVICSHWPWGELSTEPNSPSTNIDFTTAMPRIGPPLHGFIASHPLGINPTTASDNMAWILYGLRTDLGIALSSVVLSTILGIVLGLISGFSRGAADRVIMFVTDVFLCFPFLLGAMAIAPIVTSHFQADPEVLTWAQVASLVFVLVIFGWMLLARLIRGYVISLREREFIQAAQVLGMPTRRILFKELLPNMISPLVVSVSIAVPVTIELSASLAFLGLGVTGAPSLGMMISQGIPYYDSYPLYTFAPIAMLSVLVLALNLLGDSIRDAFDPKTRR